MSWLKASDTAAMHPRVLAVAGQAGADPRCVNEVFGFVTRCAIYCAQYRGDYVIDAANYMTMGFGDHERLIGLAVGAGLMEWAEEGGQRVLRLLDDEEDFLHMLSKEESEWARQRDRDNRDVTLKGPVLLRDGDNCRYCGVRVTWRGRSSGSRRGTLDHRVPGKPGTVDTLVVACTKCNSARQDDETGAWDRAHPLMSVPRKPLWGKVTARFLEDNGYLRDGKPVRDAADGCSDRASGAPSVGAAPGSVDAPAGPSVPAGAESSREGADPAASDQHGPAGPPTRDSAPADAGSHTEAPAGPPDLAESAPHPESNSRIIRELSADSRGREFKCAGTGRGGTARPGPDQDGTAGEGPPPGGDGQGQAGGRTQPPGKRKHRRKRRRR